MSAQMDDFAVVSKKAARHYALKVQGGKILDLPLFLSLQL